MNTIIRYSLVFFVCLLSAMFMRGTAATTTHNSVGNLSVFIPSLPPLPTQVKECEHSADQESLVAAVHNHDLYDMSEQIDLKDEWSKLLYWGVLSICLFIFCYPACLKIQNNKRPYMDRLILPPKYILFQSLKIPFQG